MAESFFDRMGLNPQAGGDAEAFANSMDRSVEAARKLAMQNENKIQKII